MKSLDLKKKQFNKYLEIPSSKSYANRLLILGSLKKEPFYIENLPQATDVVFLTKALSEIGLEIKQTGDRMVVLNSFPECEGEGATIAVGEGGTTARFLACLLTLGKAPYVLKLGSRLKKRPWEEFINLINSLGGKAKLDDKLLSIQGPLHYSGQLEVDCSRTTQFASGFQLALAFKDVKVIPQNLVASESYWKMTQELIESVSNRNTFSVLPDWSSASYPLAFGALNQEIYFSGLHHDPLQADAKFYHLLKSFNCLEENEVGLKVNPINLRKRSIVIDVSDCLDLVPALSFFLAHIEGTHELNGITNLVHKESDRLNEVMKLLKEFNRKTEISDSSLVIEGSSDILKDPKHLTLPDDHRMVMTAALFLLHHGGGTVEPVEAVSKSFPEFFNFLV